jgi:hypothetical protein
MPPGTARIERAQPSEETQRCIVHADQRPRKRGRPTEREQPRQQRIYDPLLSVARAIEPNAAADPLAGERRQRETVIELAIVPPAWHHGDIFRRMARINEDRSQPNKVGRIKLMLRQLADNEARIQQPRNQRGSGGTVETTPETRRHPGPPRSAPPVGLPAGHAPLSGGISCRIGACVMRPTKLNRNRLIAPIGWTSGSLETISRRCRAILGIPSSAPLSQSPAAMAPLKGK